MAANFGWQTNDLGGHSEVSNIHVSAPPADGTPVFAGRDDADYQAILAAIRAVKERLDRRTTPEMPNYRPDDQYVREMKRYGVLPVAFDLTRDPINVFEVDAAYWRSFWHVPAPAGDAKGGTK